MVDVSGPGAVGIGGSVHAPVTTNVTYIQRIRSVTWPVRVGVVPPLVHCRQDRPADHELAAAVTEPGAVVVGQVVSGLGGVGKTQLAANLAHRLSANGDLDLLIWATATSRVGIIGGYAQASAEVTGVADPNPEDGATRLLAWLTVTDRRWLIVLDDLVDPDDLTGLWPPTVEWGRTVVTTRRRDTALLANRQVVDVDVFTPTQAADYLRGKLAARPHRLDEVDGLAADLGHLPLALAQAAAYILDRGARMTCAAYRQRLVDQRRRLADLAPHALPDQHQTTVAATWELSIERADQLTPTGVARPVLQLCALLDPNVIPADLFFTRAVTSYCTTRLGRPVSSDDVDDAVHVLHRFSLITADETTAAIRIHGLLQRAVRDATDLDHMGGLAHTAAEALVEIWPPVERAVAHAQVLRANAIALHATAGNHLWTANRGVHPVLLNVGHSLGDTGLVAAATSYFQHLEAVAQQQLGPDHLDSMTIRHCLASRRAQAGDAAGAAAALEGVLRDRLRVLGPDHPDTLTTRHELARWLGEAGDPAGAVMALKALSADRLRVLGPDHPDPLATAHELAYWRGQAGDPAGAANEFESVLAEHIRVCGPDHLHTLTTRNNLIHWRAEAGDVMGAVTSFEALLTDRLRVLGPDHPDTLTTRHELARWRGEAGDVMGAVTSFEALLTDRLRVLGPDHPDTLTT
ncbi:tetratricopeptide repeat protein, partial [Micromonospora sp. NPDC049903]|uniref:tetratricopeptide repeat protein n=1 Tax=Micromonospora sp. NPDC049903 TaxID=3364276 RepID=UPI0037907710